MASLSWILTSSVLKLYSSYGSSARRSYRVLAKTLTQQPRRRLRHIVRLQLSKQESLLPPRARKTSP
jgi:hypothetical protein